MAASSRYQRLAQSLLMKTQRALLHRVGVRAGTPVLYVKAAWAEPVLYGGRGQRFGCDLDVLVLPNRFKAFARALASEGFARVVLPGRRFASQISKEWLFSNNGVLIDVDLHRALTDSPWFQHDPYACIARAVPYESVDGPILSLCPEDQVVYAAAHHAQSLFRLDGKHFEDTRRLIEHYPIDWDETWRTAHASHIDVPLAMLAAALRGSGVAVPIDREWLGRTGRLRLRVAEQFVATQDGLRRHRDLPKMLEYMSLMPSLSGRISAWPRYVARFALQRSLDSVDSAWYSSK